MEKTLLVRTSSMGDLIHTLPAINDLAKARPEIELTWLCEEGFADIARLHPFVAQVVPMAFRRWRKSWWQKNTRVEFQALKKILRNSGFNQVLDAQGLIKSAYFASLAKVPVWGLDKASAREPMATRFYQKTFAVPKGQMAITRNRLLFAAAFEYTLPEKVTFGARVPDDVTLDFVTEPYVVFLHATSRDSKLWAEDNWKTLATRVYEKLGCAIYLPWGNETEFLRAKRLAESLDYVHVAPRLSLLQGGCLLQGAMAVVGVDTGLLHLANAFDVPLIGIYTDTHPHLTGVVESEWAKNLGSAGHTPNIDEVWETFIYILTQKAANSFISG